MIVNLTLDFAGNVLEVAWSKLLLSPLSQSLASLSFIMMLFLMHLCLLFTLGLCCVMNVYLSVAVAVRVA
jgi:hypothetical protein